MGGGSWILAFLISHFTFRINHFPINIKRLLDDDVLAEFF
jgi:hypothetical protein